MELSQVSIDIRSTAAGKLGLMKEKRTLCELEETGYIRTHLDDYKKLVRKGKFVCRRCGRVAREEKNLCKPEKLA